ncbi:MAG TPA: SDR family oxidoreductase [Steroidobacteraceae bacterium]|jgi:NAD(P)-dependent dehydrogenase (short-subunit alcohol dehydrogenase family)|nr:SDR family oxidoreductase [Steroidobacteraceae bacterium]
MHAKMQQPPGSEAELDPKADHGEESYHGTGKLTDRVAIITGGDSGIGRAIAIAYAREGADIVVSYLDEHDDATETARWVREAGRRCLMIPGDVGRVQHCREIVKKTIDEFDRLDILVNNAAFQMSHESLDELTEEEWVHTFNVNMHAQFFLTKAALPHMKRGAAIVNTTSVTSDKASPHLVAYAASKSAIATFTAALGQMLAEKGIRVNCVAPGPIWTPLIPSTFPPEKIKEFGKNVPMKRPGQPKEVAPVYVFLASDDASYVTGALYPVTGGTPML